MGAKGESGGGLEAFGAEAWGKALGFYPVDWVGAEVALNGGWL